MLSSPLVSLVAVLADGDENLQTVDCVDPAATYSSQCPELGPAGSISRSVLSPAL